MCYVRSLISLNLGGETLVWEAGPFLRGELECLVSVVPKPFLTKTRGLSQNWSVSAIDESRKV